MKIFEPINRGFNSVFKAGELSVGLMVPIENYAVATIPTMTDHLKRVQMAEKLGFKGIWVRDIPFQVPGYTDAGQLFDPFTYLGYLAGHTNEIALGIASVALPLRHPLHIAKSAASVDQLSFGRLILGVATGDRPAEFPAMAADHESRGDDFLESFAYIRKLNQFYPTLRNNKFGNLMGMLDVLPKARGNKIPLLVTGYCKQSVEWNATNSDGWMNYLIEYDKLKCNIEEWRQLITDSQQYDKPYLQALVLILEDDDDFKPHSIPFGYRLGANYLVEHLQKMKEVGVNHVALNLRFNNLAVEYSLNKIAEKVLPHFHQQAVPETNSKN